MKNPFDKVFRGLSLVFALAAIFFYTFAYQFFPSGEILGIPLFFWSAGSLVIAVLVEGARRFVVWWSRRD
jgi:hypothetical protein